MILPVNFQEIKSAILAEIREGSWQSFGAGEVGADLFFWDYDNPNEYDFPDKLIVGELSGDNGACSAFNPSGEAWTESIEEKGDSFFMEIYFMKKDFPNTFSRVPQAVWDLQTSSRQF